MAKGEIFTGLPKWAQGVLAVGILAGVGFVGYKIYKKVQEDKLLEGAKAEGDAIKSDLAKLKAQGKGKTLSDSAVQQIANGLFTAMDGYATDQKAIYAQFAKVKNDADVLAIQQAYGIKEISAGKGNPAPNFKGSLSQALVDELDHLQMQALNKMLAQKGIKYRF